MLRLIPNAVEPSVSDEPQLAAVDLGSNSFHLQIGRFVDDQIYPLDSLKAPVRLACGLTADKRLDSAAQQRALDALRRFGERLRDFSPATVRVVATSTLRVAKNAEDFLSLAEQALGFPIDIVSGREEARLTYLGAVHSLPAADHQRLVVDVGGGSSELIIGRKIDPLLMESLPMGCVSYSLRFFPGGRVNKKRFGEAQLAAEQEIAQIARPYLRSGWREAIATSGSARAIARLIEQNRLNPGGSVGITGQGLDTLRALMIRAGSAAALPLQGLPSDRLAVLAGGLAILCAAFSALRIERMAYTHGALRLGMLYDLRGRLLDDDLRDSTVAQFARRYQVDRRQAQRVETTALSLFGQLDERREHQDERRFLKWAATLHEVGISIAHSGYHKHGAYILRCAAMPGIPRQEQSRLAQLVLGQRGKLEKLTASAPTDANWRLLLCLRLAVALHRSRDDFAVPDFRLGAVAGGYRFELPDGWLAANPLSAAVLADESLAWQGIAGGLRVASRKQPGSAAA